MGLIKNIKDKVGGKPKMGEFVLRRRYSLSLVNLSSLRTVFSIRARRAGLFFYGLGLFVLMGLLWLLIFCYTPVRRMLPGGMDGELRDRYEQMAMRLDSARIVAEQNDRYARNIRAILLDSVEPSAEGQQALSTGLTVDSLIEASEAERTFVSMYEGSDRYNLSVLAPIAAEGMTFVVPFSGVEIQGRDADGGLPRVTAMSAGTVPVSAIYRGTVLSANYIAGKGIAVIVLHPNEFVSVYTGLTQCYVARGEKVKAGQRIGIADPQKHQLALELWHNGTALNPAEYIAF